MVSTKWERPARVSKQRKVKKRTKVSEPRVKTDRVSETRVKPVKPNEVKIKSERAKTTAKVISSWWKSRWEEAQNVQSKSSSFAQIMQNEEKIDWSSFPRRWRAPAWVHRAKSNPKWSYDPRPKWFSPPEEKSSFLDSKYLSNENDISAIIEESPELHSDPNSRSHSWEAKVSNSPQWVSIKWENKPLTKINEDVKVDDKPLKWSPKKIAKKDKVK